MRRRIDGRHTHRLAHLFRCCPIFRTRPRVNLPFTSFTRSRHKLHPFPHATRYGNMGRFEQKSVKPGSQVRGRGSRIRFRKCLLGLGPNELVFEVFARAAPAPGSRALARMKSPP